MRVSELIALIRHRVNDAAAKYHSDADILMWANRVQRTLFRRKVEADISYGNETIDIDGSDAKVVKQVSSDTWRFFLPAWVYRVRAVHSLEAGELEATNRPIHKDNWKFFGNRTLDVRCGGAAKSIRVFAAKTPASLRPMAVQSTSLANDELIVTLAPPAGYEADREEGCLLGASMEITSVTDINRDCRGQVVVVTGQRRDVIDSVPVWSLTVTPPFSDAPEAGDTIEMHTDIEEVHAEYMIDLVAEALFQRTGNIIALQLLRERIRDDEDKFLAGLQPRTDGQVSFVQEVDEDTVLDDPDRDPYFSGKRSF